MSKKAVVRVMALLLVVALVSVCFVSRTFAVYLTDNNINISTNVIEWSYDLNGENFTDLQTFTFNLFDVSSTVNDYADLNSRNLIAPGTKGDFTITLKNTSNVKSQCSVKLTANTNGVPVVLKYDGNNVLSSGVETTVLSVANIAPGISNSTNITWEWDRSVYTGTDNSHFGKTVTVTATVMARMDHY